MYNIEKVNHYNVILEPQEEGGYTVVVPALPGCISEGETIEEAIENIKEAIELYLESLQEDGLPIPEDKSIVKEVVV
ncbi:Uncharacterized protein family UPF0150 [Thermodesulfobium narugense DSM 14796]|uniref:Uncharacterized protein family UPF0150 n=1 Tax=Thermodesulfobium narugense DSM 14796 TaxID=747365 RepID=M1E7L9_9BACT|nr:type II toxin-antitoxin system HicB family antitoxin [Thermodesulfobium narugense]AEE14054.1 Uncharacterized protein family UPF0150 [Thermodesulfobium narugense DSM 14796]